MRQNSDGAHELRRLRHSLNDAPDPLLAKVVSVIDMLEDRGAADDVIAPLRPRLARLRPSRPLRFCRLLFTPLDPLIVPADAWSDDRPTIPRSALLPLAGVVWAALGTEASVIDGMIEGRTTDDRTAVSAAGRVLWPAASRVLAEASHPPPRLTQRIGALLGLTERLASLFAEIEFGVTPRCEPLVALLQTAAAQDAGLVPMLLVLLLARLPEERRLLQEAATALGPRDAAVTSTATDQALAVLTERLEAGSGVETLVLGSSLYQAGAEVKRIVVLLGCMGGGQRCSEIAKRLDACCRLRFATALETEFPKALQAFQEAAEPATFVRLEEAARGLHSLGREGQRISGDESYDRLLLKAVSMLATSGARTALCLADRVRLVEILAGPDEALAMLDAETSGA